VPSFLPSFIRLRHLLLRWQALLASGFLIRLGIAIGLPPGFDEAYYYLYTLHPSWSYFDHPPLVALTTGFGVWITGSVSPLTIRLGTVLLYTGTLLILYFTCCKLFTPSIAERLLVVVTLIPIFTLGFGVLTLPDSSLMFFWSACLYCCTQEFFREYPYRPTYRLAVIGLLVGLACLGKYHGFILAIGLLGFCWSSRQHRKALYSRWTLAALGLFGLAIAPVLIWNAQHEWISLRYQSGRAVPTTSYQLLQSLATWGLGVAYLFPSLGLPIWWAIARAIRTQLRTIWLTIRPAHCPKYSPSARSESCSEFCSDQPSVRLKQRFLLWISLPLIGLFLYVGGYQPILPTWPMPGFWGATLLLGYQVERWRPKTLWSWLGGSGIVIALLLLLGLSHIRTGSLQKPHGWLGEWIPVATDASTQLIDIQQLRQGFRDQPQVLQALQQADFVFTNQIFIAGQVAMAIAPLTHHPITCFSDDPRGFAFWSDASDWLGKTGLYITSATFEQESVAHTPTRLSQNAVNATSVALPYQDYFQSVTAIGEIPLRRRGVIVETFKLFRAETLLRPYPRPYGS